MGHSLGRLELQGVVSRYTLCSPEICVRIETDVRRAQSRVSVGEGKRSDRGLYLLRDKRIWRNVWVCGENGGLKAIGVNLPVDRVGRGGNTRLIEWNRYGLMNPVISNIA